MVEVQVRENSPANKGTMEFLQRNARVLITGASGFVGSHCVEHLLKETDWHIVAMCRSSIAGDLERLGEVLDDHPDWKKRITIIRNDLRDRIHELVDKRIGDIDYVLHIGASSHVDRSITDPVSFALDNTMGTVNMLEWLRMRNSNVDAFQPHHPVKMYIQMSTDEVFGPAKDGVAYTEESWHRPNNPYASAKAAAEDFCEGYRNTYRLPIIIVNSMNIIGQRQHPEKLVPLVMQKILKGDTFYVHADPSCTKPGTRHYLHARNVAAALLYLLENGKSAERYNIVGEREVDNLEMAQLIEKFVQEWVLDNKDITPEELPELKYELVNFHGSRPGHDLAYRLNGDKLKKMGFTYPVPFEESLRTVVRWTMDHRKEWLL